MPHPALQLERFEFVDWLADPSAGTISRGGHAAKLEPKAMEVLLYLARRQGEVVTQVEIEAVVWAGVIVTSQSVYQAIAQLRRALADDPRHPQYIETVPRRGYRFLPAVRWPKTREATTAAAAPKAAFERAPAPEVAPASAATPVTGPTAAAAGSTSGLTPGPLGSGRARRPWRPALLLMLLLLLGLAALGAAWFTGRFDDASKARSIAVLPFRDLSPEGSQAYLAETLSEELTHALGQVDGLTVSARAPGATPAGKGQDPRRLGAELGVTHLLQGSLRRSGDRVRVVASLVDVQTGNQTWSRTYDQPAANLIGLPADIAGAVAGELRLVLVGDPGIGGSRVGTRNPTAYDYYMLAQNRYAERTSFALSEAERYFQLAIEADAGFAAAYVGLASLRIAEYYYLGKPLGETVDAMRPLIDRALQLDPQYGPALAMRGWVAMEIGDYAAARQQLEHAVQLAPNYARAQLWLGMSRSATGDLRSGLAAIDEAVRLDRMNFIVHVRQALVLEALGRMDEARDAATRAATLAPMHPNPQWLLGLLATSSGKLRLALAHYEKALQLAPERSDLRLQLATLYLDAGQPEAARAALRATLQRATGSHDYLAARAWLAFIDGQRDELAGLGESMASLDPRNAFQLADAADWLYLGGRPQAALSVFDAAQTAAPPEATQHDLWTLRWGLNSAAIARAGATIDTGDTAGAARLLDAQAAFLDSLEARGYRHWGLWYQRAQIAALRGRSEQALAALARATAAGWRRAWWAGVDPALQSLRPLPQFKALLQRISTLDQAPPGAAAGDPARGR